MLDVHYLEQQERPILASLPRYAVQMYILATLNLMKACTCCQSYLRTCRCVPSPRMI